MTKTLVLYYTLTGNTERIAKAIFNAIPGKKELKQLSDNINPDGFDLIFIGFPVYNFGPISQAKEFIAKKLYKRNIALFMTMSLTAAPASDQVEELYNLTITNCRKSAEGSNLLGTFDCPGELSEKAANALLNSEDPMLRMFGSVRSLTLGFPNENNIAEAEAFAKEIFSRYQLTIK